MITSNDEFQLTVPAVESQTEGSVGTVGVKITTDNYQEVNVQNQLVNAPASILAPSDVDIPLQINGLTPERLGFVRIHDIQPVSQ
mgnify:CR=1 FL=1